MSLAPKRKYAVLFWLLAVQCNAEQTIIRPASEQADGIAILWWSMLWVACAVFIGVMGLLIGGSIKARKSEKAEQLSSLASRNLVIAAGVIIPLLSVIFLMGGSLVLGKTITEVPPSNAQTIRVTGLMWWWKIEYLTADKQVIATTANEMHIPVGKPVHLLLESEDVIHSFWVPNLHGKTDMIPGRTNSSWFTAHETGTFRGQCAEFCGRQHSLMAFLVVAQPEREFSEWLDSQSEPSVEPATSVEKKGKEVFFDAKCHLCHTIRGTRAKGEAGPDLTHLASRQTLAAATRENNRGHLAGWISNPQNIKEGAFMPSTLFGPDDLLNLVTYLESLE